MAGLISGIESQVHERGNYQKKGNLRQKFVKEVSKHLVINPIKTIKFMPNELNSSCISSYIFTDK